MHTVYFYNKIYNSVICSKFKITLQQNLIYYKNIINIFAAKQARRRSKISIILKAEKHGLDEKFLYFNLQKCF